LRIACAFFIVFWACCFISPVCPALTLPSDAPAPDSCQNIPEPSGPSIMTLLKKANEDYDQRAEPGKAQAAADLYNQILTQNPKHYEASWRCAECYYWLADDLPPGREKPRELIFSEGLNKAKLALQAEPDSVEGNFWFGVLLGKVSISHGIFARLGAVDPIINSMEKVLSVNPNHAFAYHILGIVYRLAPGWPFSCGNLDKSLKYAGLAVENRPDSVLTHLGLGEALLAKGRKSDAEMELLKALSLPGPSEFQPETVKEKKAVEELLSKIKG
jgi:tetratricopeptide (TPR) repeat protein